VNKLESGLRGAANALNLAAGAALIAMMLHINLDVALRFLFNAPIPMTTEVVSAYYMVAVVFLPLAAVEWRDGHITVEIVSQFLGKRPQALLATATAAVAAAYFAAMAWRTGETAIDKMLVGEFLTGVINLTIWPSRFLVPLGCGLIALALAAKVLGLARARR